MINQQLAVDPKPDAIVRGGVERIGFVELRLYSASPAGDKSIAADTRIWRAVAPVEVYRGIRSDQRRRIIEPRTCERGRRGAGPVRAAQTSARANGRAVQEGRADDPTVDETGFHRHGLNIHAVG